MSAVLKVRDISKSFPGVKALDRVSMNISPGTVHALLGENGAGKSTLVKILSGVFPPDQGTILLDEQPVSFNSTREAEKAGIAIIHQELNLIPQMTVAENIFLGREPKARLGLLDYKSMRRNAAKELEPLESGIDPGTPVNRLAIGQQQMVEIARALSLHARVVIMDEPTSALSEKEVEKLFQVVKKLKEQNVAVIYISHKLDEIFAIADVVTVLRDGKHIGTRNIDEVDASDLIKMMVGRELTELFPKESVERGEELLRVESLTVQHPKLAGRNILENITFSLHKGEILGIGGLLGSGRTELMMTLFGAAPGSVSSGRMIIHGKESKINSPVDAIDNGMALVTEDRKMEGLFLQLPVRTNISIASLKKAVKAGLVRSRLESDMVSRYVEQLRIKIPDLAAAVETLSGGNQQKVILAKWMLTEPDILLLDDPTRGIDVGAKAEIYQMMSRFARQGMGIILVSSELPELLAMSDQILVLNGGRIGGRFTREQATEEKIMHAAALGQAA